MGRWVGGWVGREERTDLLEVDDHAPFLLDQVQGHAQLLLTIAALRAKDFARQALVVDPCEDAFLPFKRPVG